MKKIKRDDTEHGFEYYWADEVDALLAQPAPVQEPVGNWVWSWLMDWCKRNGIAPATQDSLFAMVKDARSKFESTPPAPQPVPVKTYHDGKPWPVAPKPWVGLTHEDMMLLVEQARKTPAKGPCPDYNERLLTLANNKLKEKNHDH